MDNDNAEKKKREKEGAEDPFSKAKMDLITQSRLRQKNVNQHNNEEQRKKSQEELQKKKLAELRKRFETKNV